MKYNFFSKLLAGSIFVALTVAGCAKKNDGPEIPDPNESDRWITLAGALMQTEPGDGNAGTMVYSIKPEDARNPEFSVQVFDQGEHVKSNRTARLQASADGKYLYNIQYTGADGGVFNKYTVGGGNNFTEVGSPVNTAPYVGTSPRWVKVSEQVGVAVNVKDIVNVFEGEGENAEFKGIKGTAVVLAIDLENPRIVGTKEFELALSPEEQAAGYHIFRLDAPVLNKAGDKLMIGTWMRKYEPGTTTTDRTSPRLGTKTVIVDYPSLENPRIISSSVATGDNSGYRSPMSYVADDGQIYQATHRELEGTGGSRFIRINQQSEFDNSYDFSLDAALGVTDSYIETWRYAGNGIGYVIYSVGGEGGYIAQINLNQRTATKMNIPNGEELDFGQYQGIAVDGDLVYIAVTGVSLDGNIYVFNSKTGEMSVGARLINKAGNRYIGVY